MDWRLEKEGSRRRTDIVAAIAPSGDRFNVGDTVEMAPDAPADFGIIAGFREHVFLTGTEEEVRLLLLYRGDSDKQPEITSGDLSPDEVLATSILRYCPLAYIASRVDEPLGIKRAVDARGRLAGPVDISPSKSGEEIASEIAALFRTAFKTPRRPRATPAQARTHDSNDLQPVVLFPRGSPHRRKRSAEDNDSENESENFEIDEKSLSESMSSSSSEDIPVEHVVSPRRKKRKETSPAKEQKSVAVTPRKRGRPPIDGSASSSPRKSKAKTEVSPQKSTSQTDELAKSLPGTPRKPRASLTPNLVARDQLHASSLPESLPCRDDEFSQIFIALQDAIAAQTGSCIYVSGTPGVGKTATVMEAVAQLQLRAEEDELPKFSFLEINGMKLPHPSTAYELLYNELTGALPNTLSSASAMAAIEALYHKPDTENLRKVMVVVLDELDQMSTKDQKVMYNFFNWPSLPYSKLVVVAIANTMDLPEQLANKINSRLGLTRITFRGYTYVELRTILMDRLRNCDIVDADAVEYIARKIAGVSGDARRALDICRRAIEIGEIEDQHLPDQHISIDHVRRALAESQNSTTTHYLSSLSPASKVFLCAILVRARRTKGSDMQLKTVLQQAEQLVQLGPRERLRPYLYPKGSVRMKGFQFAVSELVEAGIVTQQALMGETARKIRLNMPEAVICESLEADADIAGML